MFKFLKQRFRDMGHLTKLFNEAERLANQEGQAEPGAEHLVMAALSMPEDESGRRALARQGATPEAFWAAVEQQYADALQAIGFEAAPLIKQGTAETRSPNKQILYKSKGSVHDLLDTVTANKQSASGAAFSTAEIVLAATQSKFGTVARALNLIGIEQASLADSARIEIVNRAHA